jgi:hypothetical protein
MEVLELNLQPIITIVIIRPESQSTILYEFHTRSSISQV